jgi:heme/copper-type cytochrome/quinol oxidase subunit 2
MTQLSALITSLLGIVQLFITAAEGFLIPTYDTTAQTWNVTLLHIVIWVPILLTLIGAAASMLFSFIRRRRRA